MKTEQEHRYVGIGTMSKEGTSELNYLYRPGPNEDGWCMKRKHECIGGIGWGHQDSEFLNKKLSHEKQNTLQRGEFRQAAEDRFTHLYQSPWYPNPNEDKEKKRKYK